MRRGAGGAAMAGPTCSVMTRAAPDGGFVRPVYQFTGRVTADGLVGEPLLPDAHQPARAAWSIPTQIASISASVHT